jgi:4'-phosphopantetheinyl transferase
MLTENCIMINEIKWDGFSDDMVFEKDKAYVFKAETEKYYNLISNDYLNVLSADEIQRSLIFKQNKDKQRFVAGRYLLRNILSKITLNTAAEIEFTRNEFNKPLFNNMGFNVSHSGDYILIAAGPGNIGIDVEFIKPGFDFEPVLGICFGTDEIAYIKNEGDAVLNFYTFWTRKEAILKATGEGLTDNLPEINCIDDAIYRGQICYQLISFMADDCHMACLAGNNVNNTSYINMQAI